MAVSEFYHHINESAMLKVDPEHMFVASVPHMANLAREAAEKDAYSYRKQPFLVGASGFAVDLVLGRTAIITHGNMKIGEDFPKRCAERWVVEEAERLGYEKLIGIVVSGTSNKEEIFGVTDRRTETLHPCRSCRCTFHRSEVVQDDTLILTTSKDNDGFQAQTVKELSDFYDSDDPRQEVLHHQTNDFNLWNERRLFLYNHMQLTQDMYGAEGYSRAQLVHMALSASLLD